MDWALALNSEFGEIAAPGVEATSSALALSQLVRQASRGDELAFRELYRRVQPQLLRVLSRRIERSDQLVDVCQKSWLIAWNTLNEQRFDAARAAFPTFLIGVATKVWLAEDRNRRNDLKKNRRFAEARREQLSEPQPEAEEILDFCTEIEQLKRCLAQLREQKKLRPLDLRILDGLLRGESERTIARRLKVSRSLVSARKGVVYDAIRRWLVNHAPNPNPIPERSKDR